MSGPVLNEKNKLLSISPGSVAAVNQGDVMGDNQEQCFCDDEGPLRSVLLIGPWGEGDTDSNFVLTANNGVKLQVNFILRTEFLRFVHE